MDKKGIESFTLAQLSKLIKRNNPTGLDDDFIIIGENLPNTELFKYPCRVDALVAVICLEGELICNINLKEYRITTNMMIINTPENIIQVKDIGNCKFCKRFLRTILPRRTRHDSSIHANTKRILLSFI